MRDNCWLTAGNEEPKYEEIQEGCRVEIQSSRVGARELRVEFRGVKIEQRA